ncbi:hypothetical protein CHARACLAT_015500 [Characodon lateralis]|uniref:Secreted protein n=1 Tax=Characodon lateralis TaxID=208331 RepID=A0ABU7DUJ1_9TELE|nr:hypothetical protein [Characodon lateralis]
MVSALTVLLCTHQGHFIQDSLITGGVSTSECVCVCVCERETETERSDFNRARRFPQPEPIYCYHHIISTLSLFDRIIIWVNLQLVHTTTSKPSINPKTRA